ncbi:uncharacterized protein PITG_09468 [Phytophthora infestans T30-4]|uniref:Uncharacterized protein n=1 Tax=Phytophthora infestans (strain T30-4) TaxID=403677 RepID=D0NC28_PHYIT|nr:uncharacterized protein PITG_09468 [Phytophthora infestans T30-4]EEY55542.1 conserved hypothetical protein [Phytophthora infestans T30-4]|eukprot:XP_002903118.1 conserved hypothetical protein [Phytophthora infestans T30-4]
MADSDAEELLSEREDDGELDSSTISMWKCVEETSLELGIDDVEQYLLAKARLEVPRVAERLMARIFGPVQHGIVSLVTGLFLCSHVASRVQILRAIAKASESPDELEQASENRCSVYHNLAQQTSVQLVQKILGIMTDSISGVSRSSTGSEISSESALSTMKTKSCNNCVVIKDSQRQETNP